MNIEFTLSRADYIEFQLFAATKSEILKKTNKKARLRVPIIYMILGTMLLTLSDKMFAIIFYTVGILWFFFYPFFAKKRYAKHYEKFVDENFKNRFNTTIKINFIEDYESIECIDFEGESKTNTSKIEKIFEIKRFFYIKMHSGIHFIIPKYKIEHCDKLKEVLIKISKMKSIDYEANVDLDFVFKK